MADESRLPTVGTMGIINKRMIVWGPDGVPRPSSVPTISRQGIEDLAAVALSLPYKIEEVPPDLPEAEHLKAVRLRENEMEFEGMSNAEVMIIKLARSAAGGSMDAAEMSVAGAQEVERAIWMRPKKRRSGSDSCM